ncbi:peptidase M24, structural domain-containing protein [Absidia repens]|uniref:Peptidase M24, structural domain-containing protein n=1 Tax=Absidia repens TaxID=90262 RepID=A0A1X2IN01_9FUNG|nr:peptidase M24, structural domain-containing protein [Absidia repens]
MATMNETTPFLQNKQGANHWNKLKQRSMLIRTALVFAVLAGLVCGIWALQLHNGHMEKRPTWAQDMADLEAASDACLSTISRVPGDQYVQRQNRLAKTLHEEGTFAYIMEPSAAMVYYTNMTWSRTERAFLVVFTLNNNNKGEQPPSLDMTIVTPLFEETRAKEQWAKANLPASVDPTMVSWVEHGSPFATVLEVLLGRGYDQDTSGVIQIEPTTRYFIAEGIRSELEDDGGAVAVASGAVQRLRMAKTKEEIDIMRCANQLTERAIRVVKSHVAIGMTEADIEVKMTEALGVAGLIKTWVVALVDDNAAFPHGQPGKINRVGTNSLVLIDTGGELYDYQSDTTRTFFMGQNENDDNKVAHMMATGGGGGGNKTIQEAWYTVRQAQEAVLTQMKQGHSCAEVDLTARAVIEQAGWGDYFTHRLGHGIGLEMHEDPYMNQGNTQCILQPGFTFSVEPGIYVPTEFGIRLEDIVVVNQDGHLELLTKGLAGDPWTLEA